MLDDTRGFNPNFTSRRVGVITPPFRVNPSQIFFRTNFFSWHLFDQTFFWEKNCVVNIFYLNLFTIIFNQKNLLRKFYQNFEEKIFVTKTLLTKNLFFTELAS